METSVSKMSKTRLACAHRMSDQHTKHTQLVKSDRHTTRAQLDLCNHLRLEGNQSSCRLCEISPSGNNSFYYFSLFISFLLSRVISLRLILWHAHFPQDAFQSILAISSSREKKKSLSRNLSAHPAPLLQEQQKNPAVFTFLQLPHTI